MAQTEEDDSQWVFSEAIIQMKLLREITETEDTFRFF